jgi:transposase
MANWQQQVYQKLTPIFTRLKQVVKKGPVMNMDETTVQVMGEDGRSDTSTSYMWLTYPGISQRIFRFSPNR